MEKEQATNFEFRLPRDAWAIVFAIVFPSVVTWVYFVWLADGGSAGQQVAYGVGKSLQFLFPVAWFILIQRGRLGTRFQRRGMLLGLGIGIAIVLAMGALYAGVLKPQGWLADASNAIVDKVEGFGVASTWAYAGLGAFYAIGHSGLEEYYWRWFVFGQLKVCLSPTTAAILSAVGFMAHHVILLAFYFGWQSPLTYFFSLSVAVGGVIWAWLYHRSGSILGPWLSHLLVDAGIFLIGYDIVRATL